MKNHMVTVLIPTHSFTQSEKSLFSPARHYTPFVRTHIRLSNAVRRKETVKHTPHVNRGRHRCFRLRSDKDENKPIDTHHANTVYESTKITMRKDTFNNRSIWETFSVLKKHRTGSDEHIAFYFAFKKKINFF